MNKITVLTKEIKIKYRELDAFNDVMLLDEYFDAVDGGWFNDDDDGVGFLSTNYEESNLKVYPSDSKNRTINKVNCEFEFDSKHIPKEIMDKFTHISWYSR